MRNVAVYGTLGRVERETDDPHGIVRRQMALGLSWQDLMRGANVTDNTLRRAARTTKPSASRAAILAYLDREEAERGERDAVIDFAEDGEVTTVTVQYGGHTDRLVFRGVSPEVAVARAARFAREVRRHHTDGG